MPNARISMSKLKQIIQLQSSNLSVRELSRALSMSVGAISKYLAAVRLAGITWEAAQGLDEAELGVRVRFVQIVAVCRARLLGIKRL